MPRAFGRRLLAEHPSEQTLSGSLSGRKEPCGGDTPRRDIDGCPSVATDRNGVPVLFDEAGVAGKLEGGCRPPDARVARPSGHAEEPHDHALPRRPPPLPRPPHA